MKRLLLIGGGHAHVHVLQSIATAPLDAEVTLISPYPRQLYSGMLPGWIAGHYSLDECSIALDELARRARIQFVHGQVTAVTPEARSATVASVNGETMTLDFDVASIDIGSAPATLGIPGVEQHALCVRPIESFVESLATARATLAVRQSSSRQHIVCIGGGAAGVEIALALAYAERGRDICVTLVSAANTLPGRVGKRVMKALHARGVQTRLAARATEILPNAVLLEGGSRLPSDLTIATLGAAAHVWPRESGIACDAQGFIEVDPTLASRSHPHLFAGGDCASMVGHPRPKSGVFAVRAGPPLAVNLRRALAGAPLVSYVPQRRSLYLLSLGDRRAIASWGNLSAEGAWVWRWKDAIDRRFVAKYR